MATKNSTLFDTLLFEFPNDLSARILLLTTSFPDSLFNNQKFQLQNALAKFFVNLYEAQSHKYRLQKLSLDASAKELES